MYLLVGELVSAVGPWDHCFAVMAFKGHFRLTLEIWEGALTIERPKSRLSALTSTPVFLACERSGAAILNSGFAVWLGLLGGKGNNFSSAVRVW